MKSRSGSNLNHVGSKSRSLGQIIEIRCLHCRDHNIDSIFIKLAHNDCLDEISVKFESGHVGSTSRSLGQIKEKTC